MKELRSPKMKSLLARGKRRATKARRPGDGGMVGLINETAKNGYHYQVEWVHDTRFALLPWIVAYAWKPHPVGSASADYFLKSE